MKELIQKEDLQDFYNIWAGKCKELEPLSGMK